MLNIALLGCGRIAVRHAQLLSSGEVNGAHLTAVCDTMPDKAALFGQKYKVPYYINLCEMIQRHPEIDAVSILTPSGMHAQHTVEIARLKKHVIVEKPMALTLDDADTMIHECDRNGVRLFVIKQNRFNVPVVKLREALEKGRFGKLVMGTVRVRWCRTQEYYKQDGWRGTWKLDGGVLTNQASHHVDLLHWMMGDVLSVYAVARTALADIETEDTAAVVLRFRSGALGIIEATTACRPKDLEGSISILGEKGSVEIGGFAVNEMKTWAFTEVVPEDKEVVEKFSVNPPNVYGFGHKAYYEHVIDCIENRHHALVDGLEGRASLELISAIYESIETGREVQLRFNPQRCKLGH